MNHDLTITVFAFEPANRQMFTNLSLDNYNTIIRLAICSYVIYHNIYADMP